MSPTDPTIEESTAEETYAVYQRIPEFAKGVVTREEIERRLARPASLALVARVEGEPAAFKIGYDRYRDGSWYSWLGGTVEEFRHRGIAEALLEFQESWVKKAGFERLYVKTRNRFKAMRALLDSAGYQVVGVESPDHDTPLEELRILMVKVL